MPRGFFNDQIPISKDNSVYC